MFATIKTKPEIEKLHKRYEALMNEWQVFLNINRRKSDQRFAEAQDILKQIDDLNQS